MPVVSSKMHSLEQFFLYTKLGIVSLLPQMHPIKNGSSILPTLIHEKGGSFSQVC